MKLYALAVVTWAACLSAGSSTCAAKTASEAPFLTGVAPTPKNFPRHRPEDVEEMFRLSSEVGKYAVFIYQWSQPDLVDVAKQMIERSQKAGLTPVVAISPLALGGARREYEPPESVRKDLDGDLSFQNKNLHMPYIEKVMELAKLEPPYLCLATEINFLAFKDIKEYLTFGHVYKKLYPEIKKVSPKTKVFVSFQWDFFQVMARDEPDRIKEHGKLIEVFRPELDLVAFTSYPADHVSSVEGIPAGYYKDLRQHLEKNEDVMFMEIGWPTRGKGSNESQRAFIERLPELMKDVRPEAVAWSLLHDVELDILGDLATTGLITADGTKKPGFEALQRLAPR